MIGGLEKLKWLILPGWRKEWSRAIFLDEIPEDTQHLNIPPGATIDITLSDRLVLQKRHTLPRKARPQAANILALRAEALSASSQSNLEATSKLAQKGRIEDVYEQIFVRSDDIGRISQLCNDIGCNLRSVSVVVAGENVTLKDFSTKADRPFRLWWTVFAILAFSVCLMLLFLEMRSVIAKEQQLRSLRGELARLQESIDAAAESSNQNVSKAARLTGVVQQLHSQQQTTALLHRLTDALSDETWLSELVLSDDQLRIVGISARDPIVIISGLEALPWVESVALARPVRMDRQTQMSSFELDIAIQRGAM